MFRTHSFSCSSCSVTTVASSSFASFPRPSNPTSSSSLSSSSSSSSSVFAKRAFCLFAAVSTFIISSSVAVASGISPSSDEHSRLFFFVVVVFGDSFSRFLFVSAAFVFVFNLFFFLFVVVVVVVVVATASTHARDARTVVPSTVLLAVVVSSIVVAPSRFFGRVAFTILLFVAAVDVASVERSRVVPVLGVDDDVFVPIVHATTRASTSFAAGRRRLSSRAFSSHRSSSFIRRRAPFSRSSSSS